ncbi:MAG: serine O-acetyltransferase [Rhodospirillaceae bacterium]|nr:serine O-acetyltransferase [Rhodospirillaceae bacterium]
MAVMFFKNIAADLDAMMARDPAAKSRLMVALTYPCFHAVQLHRLARPVYLAGFPTLARMISQFSRFITGIEIHPGAQIGQRLFIDHGMGVVIGETAVIGDDVTLYHDVTLGGIAPSINSAAQVNTKRHPTLEDGVIVGAGAQILGDITVGKGARVGGNAVVIKNVPENSVAVGVPARIVMPKECGNEFAAYGIPTQDLPDPVARAIEGLLEQISRLQTRIANLENELDGFAAGTNGTLPAAAAESGGGDGVELPRRFGRN